MTKRIIFFLTLLLSLQLCRTASAQTLSKEFTYPETYLQFTPIIFDLGAAELGLASENNFRERFVRAGLAYTTETAICYVLKTMVHELRPDGSRYNSFPSAHTAAAFTGAELIRGDYGNGVGSAFYACGIYTGAMRVQHQRHWWWDTVAGATIGVFSACCASWLEDPVWSVLEEIGIERNHETKDGATMSLAPTCDPVSGTLCASFAIRF